jgi:hypothetical protein
MRRWVMPKRISKPTSEELTDRATLSRIMAQMGRKGGKIGGKRRMETMTAEQRSQIALKAAKARWSKTAKQRQ